jgi:5-methylcytosine-specific restriction endonuclease McrA
VSTLHIVQGGIDNGDKAWLEKAARLRLGCRSWIAPKSANTGDEVVIFVTGYGFFATAQVTSSAKPRLDWANRYGAGLASIRLIQPAISLAVIRQAIPELRWAKYPRSITTPVPRIAAQVRDLIVRRRKRGLSDLDESILQMANIDELRARALACARSSVPSKRQSVNYRVGSLAIHLYVLRRAKGRCEGCGTAAPFRKSDHSPYLEAHHTTRLADSGPDHPARVIALCPNCHRRAHYSADAKSFSSLLKRKLIGLETHS